MDSDGEQHSEHSTQYDEVKSELPVEPARHPYFSYVRHQLLNVYERLFSLVFLGNLAAFVVVMCREQKVTDMVNAAAANLLVCGLSRQPLVVNALYLTFCAIPRRAPLRLRLMATKIFHFGGVHSGTGVAACIWWIGFVAVFTHHYVANPTATAILALGYIIMVALVLMIAVSFPLFRFKRHDYFELTHRFSAWFIVALFWAMTFTFASKQPEGMGRFLLKLPAFWFHIVTTLAIVHPWALLKKVPVMFERPSDHAIRLHFSHTTVDTCQGLSLSRDPLRDWHSFAAFTDRFDSPQTSFSVLVSRAGDWTGSVIADPPAALWVRAVPVYGFGYNMRIFSRLILVTTGSGIGPCLGMLSDENRPKLRVVWQTRSPLETYGQRTLNLIGHMDPEATILDSTDQGRVDMLPIVVRLFREFQAEAVAVVSNAFFTRRFVLDLNSRGIPAYGPIFDS